MIDSCSCGINSFNFVLQEFQSAKKIQAYFNHCDVNSDGIVVFNEYIQCRGFYDKVGNPNDVSEFDVLENVVLEDFKILLDKKMAEYLQKLLREQEEEEFAK